MRWTKADPSHPDHAQFLAKKNQYYRDRHEHMLAKQREWRKNNLERHNENNRKSRQRDPEKTRAYFKRKSKEWRDKNPERVKELRRAAYIRNREKILAKQRRNRDAIRMETFNAYGGAVCACCGEATLEFLSLDHIHNNGASERGKRGFAGTSFYPRLKKAGWPPGYQVLCYNCNCAKGFWGECPHRKHREAGARI